MGEALAAAVGIALSPFAIIPAILLLFSVKPIKSALLFAMGWFLGVLVVTGIAVFVADLITLPDTPRSWMSWLRIVVGVLLVVLSLDKVIRRKGADKQPAWLTAISSATPRKAFRTGGLLSLANPKVAMLAAAGGLSIGAAYSVRTTEVVATICFAVIASVTAFVPVAFFAVARDKALRPLSALNGWLTKNSSIAVGVVLFVIGVLLVIKGVQGLTT